MPAFLSMCVSLHVSTHRFMPVADTEAVKKAALKMLKDVYEPCWR